MSDPSPKVRLAPPLVRAALLLALPLAATARVCPGQAMPSGGVSAASSRVELYGGYAYFHPLSGSVATVPYATISTGATGGATFFLNERLGIQAEATASPGGPNDSLFTIEGGPVMRFSYGRLVPFVHLLGGQARLRGPSLQPPTWGWGLTAGAGVDYLLPWFGGHVALRPLQLDLSLAHADFGTPSPDGLTGGLGEVKALRISSGLVFRLNGSGEPRHRILPLLYACEASPSEVFVGQPVTVTGAAQGGDPSARSTYNWQSNGGTITGTDDTANIATVGLAPGGYTVTGQITQAARPGVARIRRRGGPTSAECTAHFVVQTLEPPTIACAADPIEVLSGDSARITAAANSPQNRPLTYSWFASAGQLASNQLSATLDTTGTPPGPITVECRVNDDMGQTATATAVVNVNATLPPVVQRRPLCTIHFDRETNRPTRVDNEGSACLDEVALALNHDPTARLTLTGMHLPSEIPSYAVARAVNARAYLTKEKGIDPARIDITMGRTAAREVEIDLLPVGTPVRYSDAPAGPVVHVPATPAPPPTAAPEAPVERFRVQDHPAQHVTPPQTDPPH